jgi:hypothetical protein
MAGGQDHDLRQKKAKSWFWLFTTSVGASARFPPTDRR